MSAKGSFWLDILVKLAELVTWFKEHFAKHSEVEDAEKQIAKIEKDSGITPAEVDDAVKKDQEGK